MLILHDLHVLHGYERAMYSLQFARTPWRMRRVTVRLEMRYLHSGAIVYNNFPWPSFAKATEGEPDLCASASLR